MPLPGCVLVGETVTDGTVEYSVSVSIRVRLLFVQGAAARGRPNLTVTEVAAAITTAGRRAAATLRETGTLRETAGTRRGTPPSREDTERGTAETTETEVCQGSCWSGAASLRGVVFFVSPRSVCLLMEDAL